jgi:uncharacterized SAM-binding protein YcdF (DUF218 family)
MKNTVIVLGAALIALLCFAGSAKRTADDVIEDIIEYHGCYDREADEKVDELLTELTSMDERRGALWREIMAYWDYVNNDLPVYEDKLPDSLPDDDSLCIVVLGFELNDDGSMKEELIGRLSVALECARQYPNACVLCTGGGTAAEAPGITEGRSMGDWMLAHGLNPHRLIVEDKSMTTAENAMNSYRILFSDYPSVNSVAIVSSSYHIPWGSLLFEAGLMTSASERGTRRINVISNASYPTTNDTYRVDELLRWQTGGMLQMIGRNEKAMQYYFDYENVKKPAL